MHQNATEPNHAIYLDYLATTPCAPEVVEAMLPFFTVGFANPSSVHCFGKQAAQAVRQARNQVASLLQASPDDIIFTSSATESNNLVLFGMCPLLGTGRKKIVTSPIEHKSVLEPLKRLEELGFTAAFLPVDSHGTVSVAGATQVIDDQTLLVSVQAANNEIGTIQYVRDLANLAHSVGALFHTDAVQAAGKIPFSVREADTDFASVSAHKLYGPKGAAALYIRGGAESSHLAPIMSGGGQEHDLRPGTLNVPAIVGFGRSCEIAQACQHTDAAHIASLRDRLEQLLKTNLPTISVNGSLTHRLPGCTSIQFPGCRADEVLANCPLLAASLGSACTTGTPAPSHVLTAIGLSEEQANSTIRFSFGRQTTSAEIDLAIGCLTKAIQKLRA